MGILVIFLALLDRLPDGLVVIYDTLILWMNAIIGWVARQEAFVFQNISFDAVQLVLAYGILFYGIFFLSKPGFKKAVALALAVIGFQLWLFHTSYRTRQKEALFLAHQTRNSILIHQNGKHLSAMAQDSIRQQRLIADYQIAERTTSLEHRTLKNSYRWHDKHLLIIDNLGIYPKNRPHPDYVLLTGSPKLNFRAVDRFHPAENNYCRWQQLPKLYRALEGYLYKKRRAFSLYRGDGGVFFWGIGNPEPLKHNLSGYWSRRIDREHRLVYQAPSGDSWSSTLKSSCTSSDTFPSPSSAPWVNRFSGLRQRMTNTPISDHITRIPVNISNSPQSWDTSPISPATLFPNPVAAQ